MTLIETAIRFAMNAHAGQTYSDGDAGEPYILHPLRVMVTLEQNNGDVHENMLAAAVLHDVIEDCNVTRADLQNAGIPIAVIEIVETLTRDKDNESYMDYIKRVGSHEQARLVKLADLRSNLHCIYRLPKDKAVRLQRRYLAAQSYLIAQWNAEIKAMYDELAVE